YDPQTGMLEVGDGLIGGVTPPVYGYRVSGFKVVDSWLRYRMKERGGRARRSATRSLLDEIRPRRWQFTSELLDLLWVIEGSVELWPELDSFLAEVVDGAAVLA